MPTTVQPSFVIRRVLASALNPLPLRAAIILILAVFLFAGLYPFNFFPTNQVSWLHPRGLAFRGYGEVRGQWSAPLPNAADSNIDSDGTTIELWVTCWQDGPNISDLVSVYQSPQREPFAIEQSGADLVVAGVLRNPQGQRISRHMTIDGSLHTGNRRFITIATNPSGTVLYLEGEPQKTYQGLELEVQNLTGTVLLGQTPNGHQEWRGDIRGLAIYSKMLNADEVASDYNAWRQGDLPELQKRAPKFAIYLFDEGSGTVVHNQGNLWENLTIPRELTALNPTVLAVPTRRDLTDVSDVSLNLLGFIPFGGLLTLYWKNKGWKNTKAVLLAVIVGFTVSLVIELSQVFLPSRDSSLLDLVNNTLGNGLGAILAVAAWPRLMSTRRASFSQR